MPSDRVTPPEEPGRISEEDIAIWEQHLAATTPGDWQCWNGYGPDKAGFHGVLRIGPKHWECVAGLTASDGRDIRGTRADIDFVAFAHNNLPELLSEVRRLLALEAACGSAKSCRWGGK